MIGDVKAGDSGASSFDASQYPKTKKPTYWLADCACGAEWKEQGDLDRALADCDAVIRLDSGFAAAYASRGQIRRLKGDLDRALTDYEQAIQISPDAIPLYVLRGDLLRYKGEFKQALAEYEIALRLDPDYIPALTGRALTREKMGNFTQARLDFRKALDSPSKWGVQDIAKSARETANAQLAALDSGTPQPIIPVVSGNTANVTSIPTPTVSIPNAPTAANHDRGRRVALVIGNSSYKNVPALPNPQHDAEAIAASLRAIGFEKVVLVNDATRAAMLDALHAFGDEVDSSDWAMVYYAGHGVEFGGMNYLIPVDATLAADRNVQFGAVSLDEVMAAVGHAKKLKIVLLDACRDNPFSVRPALTPVSLAEPASATTRPVSRGLGKVTVQGATLVVFAAKHGQVTLDGEGANSPFAVALVQRIATPGVEISKLFRLVRDDVVEATAGRQEPYTYGSLPANEDFFFVRR
jgi:tetratricopeptide (TPR) repeat protein